MSDSSLIMASRPSIAVRLGREIARGGEGTIHELPEYPESLAKLYNRSLGSEGAAKLRAMIGLPSDRVPGSTAWPSDLLVSRGGAILGLVMPRIRGRHDLHNFFVGTSRRATFPLADYRMLVATAANLARAVAAVHTAGHVLGDLNERCAMVGSDATVKLIDCDSYQVEVGGALYMCDVGTPMYQPPELQQVGTFRGLHRTRNYDGFGLAVLIFRLLFFGRHPFAGRPLRGEAPELPDVIRALQFAWDGASGLDRPQDALQLSDVGLKAASYFRRALGPDGMEKGRPTANAWAVTLDELQGAMRRCGLNTTHWHLGDRCPICEIEYRTGITFFVGRPTPSALVYNPERDANAFWTAIESEAPPPPRGAEPIPSSFGRSITCKPYPKPRSLGWIGKLLQNIGLLKPSDRGERARRAADLVIALRRYEDLVKVWRAHDPVTTYNTHRTELTNSRDRLAALFEQRRQAIAAAQLRLGLRRFLAAHGIGQAGIKGVGRSLVATLTAHGVGTAADVSAANLDVIRGIGPKRRAALISWRDDIAKRYRPSGISLTLDALTIQQIDSQHHSEIMRLLDRLRGGAASLRTLSDQERKKTNVEMSELLAAARAVAQAEADLNAPTEA